MDIRIVGISGKFDSIPDPRKPDHRINVRRVIVNYLFRRDGEDPWQGEQVIIEPSDSCDGASRPNAIGWLVPRFGVFTLADFVHDKCFGERPKLSDGTLISRQHTDLLFYALMIHIAKERVTDGWKAKAQLVLAEIMYTAVRLLGERTWDKHDDEHRMEQA